MGIFWGFALIWGGFAYLGASLGWWGYVEAGNIWLYWPLALIFGGLSAILRGRKYSWVIMTATLLVTTFLIYDLSFAETPLLFNNTWRESYGQETEVKEEEFTVEKEAGAKDIKYKIKAGAIEANVSGITDKALSGQYSSTFMGLSRNSSLFGDTQLIELSGDSFRGRMMWLGRKLQNKLDLTLANDVPVSLETDCGASELNFDLSEYIVRRVQLSAGASDIYLKLGEKVENEAVAKISSGASNINIEVPKSIGVRIKSSDGLTANDFAGFVKKGDYYENEAYQSATKKIDIVLETGASAVEVRQY
jgi:hypothetical protein